jgi:hypothetical protein
MHSSIEVVERQIVELIELRFIDLVGDIHAPRHRMHGWDTWQSAYETSNERMRRLRIRRKKEAVTVGVTVGDGSCDASPSVSVSATEHVSSSVARAESAQRVSHEEDLTHDDRPRRPTGRPTRGGRS